MPTKSAAPSTAPGERAPDGAGARRAVLVGNPNAGKTTLFNRLTGSSAKVGNFPGITVEVEHGRWQLPSGQRLELSDLPGT